jgi:hypothetical protein
MRLREAIPLSARMTVIANLAVATICIWLVLGERRGCVVSTADEVAFFGLIASTFPIGWLGFPLLQRGPITLLNHAMITSLLLANSGLWGFVAGMIQRHMSSRRRAARRIRPDGPPPDAPPLARDKRGEALLQE